MWFYYFFCSFVVPMLLINARTNEKLFIETFLKHLSRMETWQIDRFDLSSVGASIEIFDCGGPGVALQCKAPVYLMEMSSLRVK